MTRERFKRVWPPVALFLLTLLFVALEPAPARDPFAAVSPAARWVSVHDAPGKRLGELAETSALRDVLRLAGHDPFAEGDAARGPARTLFPGTTLVIREARMGPALEPGWVVVSRVGSRQTQLRLFKEFGGFQGYVFFDNHHGHRLWISETAGRPPRVAALVAGLLVVCEHPNPNAIRDVVDRIDGRRHTLRDLRPHLVREWAERPASPDQGRWFGSPAFPEPFQVKARVTADGGLALTLNARETSDWFGADRPDRHDRAALLAGPRAPFMAHLPAFPLLGLDVPSTLVVMADSAARTPSPVGLVAPLFLLPAENEETARARSDHLMRALGGHTGARWHLQTRDDTWRYEPSEGTRPDSPRLTESPAATWKDGLLLLGKNETLLQRLLTRAERPEATFELRDVAWRDPEILAWLDGPAASEILEPLVRMGGFGTRPRDNGEAPARDNLEKRIQALSRLHLTIRKQSPHSFEISIESL